MNCGDKEFYMWKACPVWACVRLARLLMKQGLYNLNYAASPACPCQALAQELGEMNIVSGIGLLVLADARRQTKRFKRRAKRWLTR